MSRTFLWERYVGGPADGKKASSADLMVEAPVDVDGAVYAKRKMVLLGQRVLVVAEVTMSTAEVSRTLLRALLDSHPGAGTEEPKPEKPPIWVTRIRGTG